MATLHPLKPISFLADKLAMDSSHERSRMDAPNLPANVPVDASLAELPFAGFVVRFCARFIDTLVLTVPGVLTSYAANTFLGAERGPILTSMMSIVVGFLYYGVLQAELEGTLGKRWLGIALVNSNLERPTVTHCLIRHLVFIAGILPFGLGIFWILGNSRKQAWHDLAAGTVVLNSHWVKEFREYRWRSASGAPQATQSLVFPQVAMQQAPLAPVIQLTAATGTTGKAATPSLATGPAALGLAGTSISPVDRRKSA